MGLHAFTEPDFDHGFIIRFGWICDICGKEIKDPRDGGIDYTCLDPGEAKKNKRLNEILLQKHFPEEDCFKYIVYHKTTCTPEKRHRYWQHLDNVVDQLSLPLTKARKKV
jgi:hypothetical protein|tara:strand:+ start:520 stop:849 length:330 start_codon:yes stop_codon:yes gene_type:complete